MAGLQVRVLGRVLCLVIATALPACSEDQPPARAPIEAPAEARMSVYLKSSEDPDAVKLVERLTSALARRGHNVTSSESDAHELTADVRVTLRETKGLLQVYIDGKPKKSFVAEAAMQVRGAGRLLDTANVEYEPSEGPDDEDLRVLVASITGPAARRYVAALRQQRTKTVGEQRQKEEDAADAKEAEQLAARKEQRRLEESSWNQVVLSECTAATQLTACDAVKEYLARYPAGRHVAEAKKALEQGAPLVAKLVDERDWRVARPEACKAPKTSTDCDGVTSYVAAQPAGVHLSEAQSLLAQAEPKLAAVRKGEERREKEEEAKVDRDIKKDADDQKRQEREQCKKDCIGNMCFSLRPGKFEICVDRCVKANCD